VNTHSGVTSYCPTLVTCSPSTYREVLPLFPDRQSDDDESGSSEARIIGLHLEGPYFAMEKKGAHNKNYITDPKTTPLKKAYGNDILQHLEAGKVKIVTMAPELAGGNKIIKQLSCKGVKVSMGHSMATCEEGEVGVEEGATLITHLFNAMPPFHHREPGLIGTVLGSRNNSRAENENGRVGLGQGELYRPYYSIICDGIHCHKNAVNMAHNSHPGGTILVTDAMSAMGLDDGAHKLGSKCVNCQLSMCAGMNEREKKERIKIILLLTRKTCLNFSDGGGEKGTKGNNQGHGHTGRERGQSGRVLEKICRIYQLRGGGSNWDDNKKSSRIFRDCRRSWDSQGWREG